jgi:hypothetical protein
MKKEITDALLRQFLLGKVDDEERQRLESLYLTDSTMRERVLAVEQELIEDYLEDSLSPGDREEFLLRYGQTAEQQRKLRITKSIKDWAVTASGTRETVGSDPSTMSIWSRLRLRPAFVVPIAAVIVLALVFGVIWVNRRMEQRRHLAIEQELARLNDPANLRNIPPGLQTLTLQPGTLRSGPQSELKLRSEIPEIDVRLRWLRSEEYPSYRAVLRRFDDGEEFTIPILHPDRDGTIRLLLSTRILRRGLYQLHVTGLTADGSPSETEEYSFTVIE